jgi:hypothetical protein
MEALHLPCISVDIVGGMNWNEWKITATAIVPNNQIVDKLNTRWCKSLLFTDQGANGLCQLAAGLVSAYDNYPKKKNDFGCLLGPVAGKNDNTVVKAYVNKEYQKPHLNLVQEYIDGNAKLYSTTNKKIQLLEVVHVDNDWSKDIIISMFTSILTKLSLLHKNGWVHGDVRLANMLSAGILIDFDLVGKHDVATYPRGYQSIRHDGKRHEEIETAINTENDEDAVELVKLKKSHDCYSMAYVMRLFKVYDPSIQQCWESAADFVEDENIQEAIDVLNEQKGQIVQRTENGVHTLFVSVR